VAIFTKARLACRARHLGLACGLQLWPELAAGCPPDHAARAVPLATMADGSRVLRFSNDWRQAARPASVFFNAGVA